MTQKTEKLLAGASGYSFKEWKGDFYPQKLKQEDMLEYYAQRLPTVEINSTFYGLPPRERTQKWAETVPAPFVFSIKASKSITHEARLNPETAGEAVAALYDRLEPLGKKRGAVLFQLPPSFKKDLARLQGFLELLPKDHRAAFEFRNDSWFDDEVYEVLRAAKASLCLSEREDATPPPLVETADFGYLRLRLENYDEKMLAAWAQKIADTKWKRVYAYFMHEPTAPAYAAALMKA